MVHMHIAFVRYNLSVCANTLELPICTASIRLGNRHHYGNTVAVNSCVQVSLVHVSLDIFLARIIHFHFLTAST